MEQRVLILGSGPAGNTAALYTARGGVDTRVIAGYQAGGQLMLTTGVENYPGFPEGVQGPELMDLMRRQAERFGARYVDRDAVEVDFSRSPFRVRTDQEEYQAEAVIVATGASAKWLGLESEQRLRGHGVSSCATCDGFFFKDQDVVVVGGGDTACEEALFLTRFCRRVTIVHRRDRFRASQIMQDRVFGHPKIDIAWNAVVREVLGEDRVEGVVLYHKDREVTSIFECQGVFVAIGHKPNTDFLRGHLELDEKGYIVPRDGSRSNVEGVFVAGDVVDSVYRQAITAAGMGCRAALDALRYLEDREAG